MPNSRIIDDFLKIIILHNFNATGLILQHSFPWLSSSEERAIDQNHAPDNEKNYQTCILVVINFRRVKLTKGHQLVREQAFHRNDNQSDNLVRQVVARESCIWNCRHIMLNTILERNECQQARCMHSKTIPDVSIARRQAKRKESTSQEQVGHQKNLRDIVLLLSLHAKPYLKNGAELGCFSSKFLRVHRLHECCQCFPLWEH
mmetsp:Transcript_78578/g.139428  ORF Transcript_78578/g.139428 Transcript_78578/m.139428 type:complete len:203 (-) Transcript_78578:707-1315(-)